MTPSPPPLEIYNSPKRKRGAPDSIECDPKQMATTSLEYPFCQNAKEQSGWYSGSYTGSRVTEQLVTFHLHEQFVGETPVKDAGHAKKRFAKCGEELALQDVSEGTSWKCRCTSPPSSSANNALPTDTYSDVKSSISSSTIVERPRVHCRSPPLRGTILEDNPMTWNESEITGHNPTDPNDDGYGMNGIGFKPTPEIAWARSQKRKQQLAAYRNREAQEARQRRRDKRRGGSVELSAEAAEVLRDRGARVRFRGLG